eukprot:scaffold260406_cov31-Attheya_sp.AAC.1
MFDSASVFNQDLSLWNVSSVTSMKYMFFGATAFNQNLSSWNLSSVTKMYYMFYQATAFNQDLCDWAMRTPSLSSHVGDNSDYGYDDDKMFVDTSCLNPATPTLASPGGTIENPHPGPFCHECSRPLNSSRGLSILK